MFSNYNLSYSINEKDPNTGENKRVNIYGLEDCLRSIKFRMDRMAEQNAELSKRLQEVTDDKWINKQLIQLRAEQKIANEDLGRGFSISKSEQEKIDEWLKAHHHPGGAIGGTHSYCFTPTSLGVIGSIKCTCGESFTFQNI